MLKMKIADTAQSTYFCSDEPEDRLWKLGAKSLSTIELLSLLLVEKKGTDRMLAAKNLLEKFNGLLGINRAGLSELNQMKDVRTAMNIKVAIELGARMLQENNIELPVINSPADAAALVQYDMSAMDHEELWIMILNIKNKVMKIEHLYKGSVNSSQVRIGEIFKTAITLQASTIIMVHNHPSLDISPSPDDVALTRGVVSAGKMLDITVLDHLVIGGNKFCSLKERGLGFA